jgi:hypothetical protein
MGFANERRGLRLAGSSFVYLAEGAYGVIFVDRVLGRIRKIYRRKADEDHVRDVFKAETDAYRLAEEAADVAPLVPGHFNICSPSQTVVDRDGNDVSAEFIPDLAFEAEYLDGSFLKFGNIDSAEASRIRELFHKAGIMHTTDMSVCLSSSGQVIKAIDFAVEEHELWG